MTSREPFNPRFEACGFHPGEIVARRRDLTDGQKWLYDRMVRWARASDGERENERAGEVWRSQDNIASELGKSAKQVGRDLAKLEAKHLLAHRKRDGRKSNTYFFLFHPDFEQTCMSSQTVAAAQSERTQMSAQQAYLPAAEASLNRHPRRVRTDLNGHPRPSNQKVFNQQGMRIQRKQSSPVVVRRERPQHHRDDAAAKNPPDQTNPSSAFVHAVEDATGRKLSRGDLVYCAELERSGLDVETVRAGVLLGLTRKMMSDGQHGRREPIRSLRYFGGTIAEAAKGLPPGYVNHLQKRLGRERVACDWTAEDEHRQRMECE